MKRNLSKLPFRLLTILALLAGCSHHDPVPIGTWRVENGKVLVFQKGGTFLQTNRNRLGAVGRYTMTDPTHIRITIPMKPTNSVSDYRIVSVSGDDMTLETVSSGKTGKLQRLRN